MDYQSKVWTCPFSNKRNHFPQHYAAHITAQKLPIELRPRFTTVEYEPPGRDTGPPVFLFVLDTCSCSDYGYHDEFIEVKDSLHQTLCLLPEEAIVGLITFSKMVHVHDLTAGDIPNSYCLRGDKDYSAAEVSRLLRLTSRRRCLTPKKTDPDSANLEVTVTNARQMLIFMAATRQHPRHASQEGAENSSCYASLLPDPRLIGRSSLLHALIFQFLKEVPPPFTSPSS